jgi:hypothetical protein
MKHSVDRDIRLRLLVEDSLRKTAYQGATVALVNDRVQLGSTPDAFHARIHQTQELLAQSGPATLIPDKGFRNI